MLIPYAHGIYAVDADYTRPLLAAIHLVVDGGQVAIIDTAHNESLPRVQAALAELGLGAESVAWVILTHIHLDHAGGAGRYMQAFPHAQLVVHPRGARHMAEPAKLVAGVEAVYGKERARALYGEILPVPAERIVEAVEGTSLPLGARTLHCYDLPGHARHHILIHDPLASAVFTGDTFGLSYREFDVEGAPFVFPTTSPAAFDPEAMHRSISRIEGLAPRVAYLTHYSEVGNIPKAAAALHRHIDAATAIAQGAPGEGSARQLAIQTALQDYLVGELRRHGSQATVAEIDRVWGLDLELNAQGLCVWLDGGGA